MKTDLLALLRRVDRAIVDGYADTRDLVTLRDDVKLAIAEMEQAVGPLATFGNVYGRDKLVGR